MVRTHWYAWHFCTGAQPYRWSSIPNCEGKISQLQPDADWWSHLRGGQENCWCHTSGELVHPFSIIIFSMQYVQPQSMKNIWLQYSQEKNSFICNYILWRAYEAKPKLILHAYTAHWLIDPLIFYRSKRFHDKFYTLLIPIFGINYSNWEHFAEHFAIFESTTPWHMNHMFTNPSVEYFDLIRFWSSILLNIACTTSFDLIAFLSGFRRQQRSLLL